MLPSASVSFRKLPRTSAGVRYMCGGMAEGGASEIMRKTEEYDPKWQNPGVVGEILIPSVSVSYCGRPWTSATCVDGRRKMRGVEL